jgi:hypothetical protein
LHVSTSGNTPIIGETTGGATSYFNLRNTGGQAYIAASTNDLLFALTASATEGMRLTSTGLGIGTSSPAAKLVVESASAESVRIGYSSTKTARLGVTSGGDLQVYAFDSTAASYKNILLAIDGPTSAGNVGIGTSSPFGKLNVQNGTLFVGQSAGASQQNNLLAGYGQVFGGLTYGDVSIRSTYDGSGNGASLDFYTSPNSGGPNLSVERMRIDSSGNLLVGTTSGVTSGGIVIQPVAGQSTIYIGHITGTGSGASYEEYYYAGTKIGSITQSGTTAVLFNVTSDQRLKENIQDAESASALIDALQVRQFDWKTDNTHQRYGFVSQELVTVAPEAVHQPADPDEMMAVDYSKLVPMLVKEIQSLRKRLTALESKEIS